MERERREEGGEGGPGEAQGRGQRGRARAHQGRIGPPFKSKSRKFDEKGGMGEAGRLAGNEEGRGQAGANGGRAPPPRSRGAQGGGTHRLAVGPRSKPPCAAKRARGPEKEAGRVENRVGGRIFWAQLAGPHWLPFDSNFS